MEIVVIDQGPELFWYINNALTGEDVQMKHLKSKQLAFDHIFNELPDIIVINGDDPELTVLEMISKIRNHAFLRNIQFIVSTGNSSLEFRKSLMIAGAGFILYRNKYGFSLPITFLKNVLDWFMDIKSSDHTTFPNDQLPVQFNADLQTFGRMCAVYEDATCLIECNLDLKNLDSLEIENNIFEEIGLKKPTLTVLEKDPIGRYYQYAHSYRCKINFADPVHHEATWREWINQNNKLTKAKNIKVVYFENHPGYRETLRQTIKADSKYCARGYKNLDNILDVLEYQKPHMVLINRNLIELDQASFLKIKDYFKKHNIFVFTYSEQNSQKEELEEYKKNYPFALHSSGLIELSTLESMVAKIIEKNKDERKQIVFGKHSAYSRLNIHLNAEVSELGLETMTLKTNLKLARFAAISMSSNIFSKMQLGKNQFLRVYDAKATDSKVHKALFIAQNNSEKDLLETALTKIKENGFENWKK